MLSFPIHCEQASVGSATDRAIYDSLKLGAREMGFLALHQHLAPNIERLCCQTKDTTAH